MKKLNREQILNEIEKLIKSIDASCVIYEPINGIRALYKNQEGRIFLMDYFDTEKMILHMEKQKTAESVININPKNKLKNNKFKNYIS